MLRLTDLGLNLLARIGFYSYSIYIWHMFFIWMILPHLHIRSPLGIYWASLIGPIPFGILLAKLIEIPVLRFRDRAFPTLSGQLASNLPKEKALDSVASR